MARQNTLRGRDAECATLDRLLGVVRRGESRALVLRGEPGVGKTALLDYAIDAATDLRVLRAVGVESERELAFAALHQLCVPMLDRLERLPGPQQEALRVAFGLSGGKPPDRFVVGLAALSLVSEEAEERPVLCAVDDAQWLDVASALALAFVARRLLAESAAIVFATREPIEALSGLPEMVIDGVGEDDARLLLASGIRGPLDERVRETIIAETRGNPLALLELPRGLTPVELAGGFALPEAAQPLADRIQQSFLRRAQSLPPRSQRLLLTAAAEPLGDVALLWRAAERLGVGADAVGPAEAAGLIEVGARVRFRHPLVRSAIYRAAAPSDRREVHRALAEATDSAADPDRRAWHRAHSATGLDEAVAEELERSADRAQSRGGVAAMAAFLEQAAELTPDPARRGARALAAAQAMLDAGAPDSAHGLLATAELTPLDDLERARLQRLRARIAFALRRGSDAPALLLDAAERLVPLDPDLARETCLEALAAGLFAGGLANGRDLLQIVRAAPPVSQPPGALDLLLNGLATRATEGYAAGVAPLREALEAFQQDGDDPATGRWLWLACRIAADLWEHETWDELAARGVRRARETGALSVLPLAASYRAGVHVHAGEYAEASALLDEAYAVTQATHTAPLVQARQIIAAYRGNEGQALELIEAGRREATARGQGTALSMIECASAVLFNGLGRYDEALAAAQRACARDELSLYALALVELIEAAAHCDRPQLAAAALERLGQRTRTSGTEWALGIEARSRALLTDGPSAEPLYEEAVERLAHGRLAPYLARAQLVYGEWLRREKRRMEAREQLRAAHDTFSRIGAEAFAERARRELLATGETARRRTDDTRGVLTPQEAQIARLAQDGLSNPEIGAQLFISPRTVQYHLRKVFLKLDITSRNQLGRLPPGRLSAA